jgi:hypothetical protein
MRRGKNSMGYGNKLSANSLGNKEKYYAGKDKKKKPWKSCTWYPDKCDAAGCDIYGRPCREYESEETW